jgi:hypothetical protein
MILLRIFKDNRLPGTVAVIVLLIAIYVPSLMDAFSMGAEEDFEPHTCMPFYQLIFGAIHKVPVLNHLVAMMTTFLISYILIRIGVRDQLLQERSIMPAIFFLFFTPAVPAAREVSPALISSLFYILCFVILFEVHDKKPNTISIFFASLILALGSMFCLKLIWFVPLIWISLWTMRSTTWREFLFPVVAYALLALFLFTWYWGVREDGQIFVKLIKENMAITGKFEPYHYSVYFLYGYLLLLVGIASIHMIDRFQSRKTVVQNIYQVMFYMFLAAALFFVFVLRFEATGLVYIAFPVTFVLSNYFHQRKNPWIHELAIWMLVGMVIYVQFTA